MRLPEKKKRIRYLYLIYNKYSHLLYILKPMTVFFSFPGNKTIASVAMALNNSDKVEFATGKSVVIHKRIDIGGRRQRIVDTQSSPESLIL